jgi:hypothetical protein
LRGQGLQIVDLGTPCFQTDLISWLVRDVPPFFCAT